MTNSELSDIEEQIIKLLKDAHKNLTYKQIKRAMHANTEEREKNLKELLKKLENEGYLYLNDIGEYQLFSKCHQLAIGEIKMNGEGKIYVKVGENQVFIAESHLKGAIVGDKVVVKRCNYKVEGRSRGEIDKILIRDQGTLIFDYIDGELVPYNWPNILKISIPEYKLKKLVNGSRLLVRVSLEQNDDVYEADIVSVIGHKDDPDIDINTIVSNFNVVIGFTKESMKQASKLPRTVTEKEIQERVANGGLDLRDKVIFTIDGKGAKDKDDAVSIEKLPNGNYRLGVHIADVSHYIPENSPLDLEARERSTSIYPYNCVIPMLPHIISNEICSLNPNEDKLTFSCIMEIDPTGKIMDYQLVDTVIRSRMQMSYQDINDIFEKGIMHPEYEPYIHDLAVMFELSEILTQAKIKRGFLSFGDDEVEFEDDKGIPVKVRQRVRGMSEKMIENFMLAANESVATFTYWFDIPAIYRNHPKPNVQSIKEIIALLGLNIHIPNNLDDSLALQNIMNKIKKYDENGIYSSLMLQAQKRASYSDKNEGHFGLALKDYTHFTSPIRRYPDLMTHRIIRMIRDHILSIDAMEQHKKLVSICDHASRQEKVADKVEKAVNQYKMIEYMEQHIGETFEASISFIGHSGVSIKTEEGITGKISFESLRQEGFSYDSSTVSVRNSGKGITLFIGDRVKVLVKSANKEAGKIEFLFTEKLEKHKQKQIAI